MTIDGGYAQYVTLRSEAVCWVPKDLDPAETAPLLCAGITTFSKEISRFTLKYSLNLLFSDSLRHMEVGPGDIVAVQGIGLVDEAHICTFLRTNG